MYHIGEHIMIYPKIKSLWKRQGSFYTPEQLLNLTPEEKATRHKFTDIYTCLEFTNVKKWMIQEKIDGMNIRILYKKDYKMSIRGRTDYANLPPKLLEYLQETFTKEYMEATFIDADEVVLYGEGHGPKIQNGGFYSKEQRFVLFDVLVNNKWWFDIDDVEKIARQMHIPVVPVLGFYSEDEIVEHIKNRRLSVFAKVSQCQMEGIVARAYPMMLFRDGTPIKFKLKCKDFK